MSSGIGHAIKKLTAKALQRLKTFWPHLIEAVLQSENPQMALMRLMPLVDLFCVVPCIWSC